ncbi:MAG TPA: hypothetical protein VFP50_07810 [Anaeromyxobacteraceae bacterium]|nr:hypothetical protein [Anaeromyxobacteraceae bacterium]
MTSATRAGLLAAALLATAGCAGARYAVRADHAHHPISFSPALPDADGRTLRLGEELEPLGSFRFSRTPVGILYGATGTTVELSEELDRRVDAARGEGVVNLSLAVSNCATGYFFPLNLLPILPGCQVVEVSGVVVARRRSAPVAFEPPTRTSAASRDGATRPADEGR